MGEVTLVLGGARSGKSTRALELAAEPPHVFIATAEALDDEMADRIARHRAERAASWRGVEAPVELAGAIREESRQGTTLVVDCLTVWLSNLMHAERDCEWEVENLLQALAEARGHIVLVSNEVGMGLVPDTALGRRFRDEQGRLNRRLAEAAGRVELVVAGLSMVLKG